MPKIGDIYVPDNLLPAAPTSTAARPSLGAIVSGAAQQAYGQVRYGLPYAVEKSLETATPEDEAAYQQGLKRTSQAANLAAPASVDDLTSGKVGFTRFVAENLAGSLPQTATSILGGVVGARLGGVPGALAGTVGLVAPQFVGSNVDRAVQETGGLTQAQANKSLFAAPLQAASDALVERYLPGAGHVVGDLAATQTGNFLARTAKSIVKAGASEAVAEAGQQLGERAAAGLDVTGPQAASEYVNAAVTAFAVGGVLGAGGGIRRLDAHVKPAADVTTDNLTQAVDSALSGEKPALTPISNPSYQPPRLALPAPEAFQAPVTVGADGVAVTPVQAAGGLDPSILAAQDPTQLAMGADARTAVAQALAQRNYQLGEDQRLTNQNALDLGRGLVPDPSIPAALRATQPAFDPAAALQERLNGNLRSTTSPLALDASGEFNGTANAVDAATPRLFASEPIADLHAALAAKGTSPEVQAEATREVAQRTAEAAGNAPLTTDNFQARVDEAKSGLTGQFVKKLTATSPDDLKSKVYGELLDNPNAPQSVTKLAQRLGLLDENEEPTAAGNAIEEARNAPAVAPEAVGTPVATTNADGTPQAAPTAAPTAAAVAPTQADAVALAPAAADPAFADQWKQLQKDAGINRLRSGADLAAAPANLQAAQSQVFRALADDKSNAQVSQTEKLARTMGLVTNDENMDVTPLGRKAFLGTPEGLQETTSAATQQGYSGAQQAVFNQGVQAAQTGAEAPGHTSFEDMAAYQAGKVWAQDFVEKGDTRTAAQTDAIRARQDTRANGKAVAREDVKGETLTPGQINQRALNNLLDAADLRNVPDTDVNALRRMVRDGASPTEVGKALQDAQGGKTLFQQPEATKSATPALPTRGQPIFKEMNTGEKGLSKAASRGAAEDAVRTFRLREVIKQAVVDKEITAARADKLNDMLDEGRVDQVGSVVTNLDANSIGAYISDSSDLDRVLGGRTAVEGTPYYRPSVSDFVHPDDVGKGTPKVGLASGRGMDDRQFAAARRDFWKTKEQIGAAATDTAARTSGASDIEFERGITGKDFNGVADYMIDHAPSPYLSAVMKQIKSVAATIQATGHKLDVQVVKAGDQVPLPVTRPSTRAYAQFLKVPNSSTVYLKSAELGPAAGTNFQVAGHEMVHAVTMAALDYGRRNDQANTRLGKAVRDLRDLGDAVVRHFNARVNEVGVGGLTDFEKLVHDGRINALDSQDEVLAWGLTNPDFQRYLQGIEYAPRQSVFGKMVDLVRSMLGLDGKYNTALTELMRVSEQVMGAGERDLAPAFARNDPGAMQQAALSANLTDKGADAANRTVDAANTTTQRVAATISDVADKIDVAGLKGKARRAGLYVMSQNMMDRQFGQQVPSLIARSDAQRAHDAVRGRFASMGDQAYQGFEALERQSKDRAHMLGKLMAATTEFQLDPDKAFVDHTHLANDPNTANLTRLHGELVEMKNVLSRGDGAGYKLFQEFRQRNEGMNYARLASELHALVAIDPELTLGVAGADVNPMDTFMAQADLATPGAIRDHWQTALQGQLAAAQQFVNLKRGEAATGTASDIRGMNQHLAPIEAKIAATHEAIAGMARAPYFHLGRFGDNFGSATIRKLEGGSVDPRAQEHVAKALADADFTNIQISTDNTNPKLAARFESVSQTNQFRALMEKLHDEGYLAGEKSDIQAGPRDLATNLGVARGLPQYLNEQIQRIETDPRYQPSDGMTDTEKSALEERKKETIQIVRDAWLEGQPDSAISKVLTARKTLSGYDPNMIRNFAHRWNVGSTSLANVSTSAKLSNAMKDMRTQLNEARHSGSTTDPNLVSDILTEVLKRDASNPVNPTAGSFSTLRSVSHAYYLGLSPAYGAVQLMQVGTNALPELAKTHGYAQSFHAIRRASTAAFAVMKAATAEAAKGGASHYADVALTETALQRSGLNQSQTDFLRRMIATGSLDIGQSANALSQIASSGTGSRLDVAMKYASAIGLHTETFSRLVTALAAHELHGGTDTAAKASYAQNVVSNSMFDYQSWNTARALGKQGFAGPITPLLTQFMTYSAQMTEKLYSEAASAIGKARVGETPEQTADRARASRVFLAGHLTAITALAGTLGLPFASVFATGLERLVNSIGGDDTPFDATASWRNFLAGVLGKDVAEVVSRGAPRALGFDLSGRVGESDLLPFSAFLGDKRGWRESVQSALGRSTGAAPDMLLNVADAGNRFGNGDVLGGMKSLLPVAFKGPVEAYRMTTEGYVDSKGQKLPMTPAASAILYQLLGFTPAEKAEYSEARGDQQTRRVELTGEAQALRNRIVKAMTTGDTATAHELVTKAQAFDTANPTFAVIPSLAGAIQRQTQSQAQARALGTPVGVPLQDIAGRHLTGYANFN